MPPWTQVLPQVWVGDLLRPFRGEFDYVLTFSDDPSPTDEGLRHRHLPLPHDDDEAQHLIDVALSSLERRWFHGDRLLLQSPGGYFGDVVVAAFAVHLGATVDEATLLLTRSRPGALTDPQHLQQLRNWRVARA